ncbi:MAG: hypothetical protein DDT38_00205 [Firmicutes bacterium]|nr:hypothetical protein [candidate division NPL-UPA2 bacterium]
MSERFHSRSTWTERALFFLFLVWPMYLFLLNPPGNWWGLLVLVPIAFEVVQHIYTYYELDYEGLAIQTGLFARTLVPYNCIESVKVREEYGRIPGLRREYVEIESTNPPGKRTTAKLYPGSVADFKLGLEEQMQRARYSSRI